jgi:glycosyltransferase involved in cell wall biosynthesis
VKLLLITDAWHPQKNGVVVTLSTVLQQIRDHEVCVLHPGVAGAKHAFKIYHDVTLVRNPFEVVGKYFDSFRPDRIHLVTEGPLGFAGRLFCWKRRLPFTTSYHTQLPEYGWHLYRVPPFLIRSYLRWFHGGAKKVLVATPSLAKQLGYKNAVIWGRGVDLERFHDREKIPTTEPTVINIGRVSREKNLDVFCGLEGYRRILVGDGPYLAELRQRYPKVEFAGHVPHESLRSWYSKADVFVFPSKTDTFGLVMLEAMACGLPVVAYDVTGPKDIVRDGVTGFLSEDLAGNVARVLANREEMSRNAVAYAREQGWQKIADQFVRAVCDV